MAEESLRKLLVSQRRRLVATVLGFAERELYTDLTDAQQAMFRSKFLGAVDSYHDLMLDILGSQDAHQIVNVEAMELLRALREQLRERQETS